MLVAILFIVSSIVSLISLFYSISSGYFDYNQYEQKLYKPEHKKDIENEKMKILNKYIEEVYVKK